MHSLVATPQELLPGSAALTPLCSPAQPRERLGTQPPCFDLLGLAGETLCGWEGSEVWSKEPKAHAEPETALISSSVAAVVSLPGYQQQQELTADKCKVTFPVAVG